MSLICKLLGKCCWLQTRVLEASLYICIQSRAECCWQALSVRCFSTLLSFVCSSIRKITVLTFSAEALKMFFCPSKLDCQKCYSIPSEGSISFLLPHRCFSGRCALTAVYIQCRVEDEPPVGECSCGRFRTCSNEVLKFTVWTAQSLAIHCCALLVVLARRRDTHTQILASIVRQAHLPNSSVEKSLCVSHLHMQDFYIASFLLCAEVLKKDLDTVHTLVPRWL